MKRNRISAMLLAATIMISMLTGCASGAKSESKTDTPASSKKVATGETIKVNFWCAPAQFYYDFWSGYAQKFNAAGVKLDGKPIEVVVQQMPGQPSSEAGIQNAIATGTVPAISEGVNRSFAGTLANSNAICDIGNEDWYKQIVSERKLTDVMNGWKVDNKQYVIPLYVNPMTFQYNSKVLKTLGVTKVPETLADLDDLLSKYNTKKNELKSSGVTHFMYRYELTRPDSWWDRWFDFESEYKALSKGGSLVDGNKLTVDKNIAKQVFELYGKMGSSLLTGEIPQIWQQKTVPVAMGVGLPWEVKTNKAAGKKYGLDGDYVFGPTLVRNQGDTPYCFADSKGLVFYKNSNIPEDQHKGAVEFVKWVFLAGGKDIFDADWLTTTSMLPVRGDLGTNANLKTYFSESPEMLDLSKYVANAIPCMSNAKMADILTALGTKGLAPYISYKVTKAGDGQVPDATTYVNAAYDGMKTAGGLE